MNLIFHFTCTLQGIQVMPSRGENKQKNV